MTYEHDLGEMEVDKGVLVNSEGVQHGGAFDVSDRGRSMLSRENWVLQRRPSILVSRLSGHRANRNRGRAGQAFT